MSSHELVAYVNGEIVAESEAKISVFDLGFLHGDAVFDTARTFKGVPFKLDEHLDRLERSCRYVELDPGLSKDELRAITLEVLERNLGALAPDEDFWVSQRVGRGVARRGFEERTTVVIECTFLPLAQRARYYRDGLPLISPSVRRTPAWAQSPRAKTHNYMNIMLAEREVHAHDPDAVAWMLDQDGNLAEGWGSNVFVARDGALLTPRERSVLPGISRAVVFDLCHEAGIDVREADLDPYDLVTADEAFVTSTSFCICPVASWNHRAIGAGRIPGRLTERLLSAYSELVGLDIVGQYLAHLPGAGETATVPKAPAKA